MLVSFTLENFRAFRDAATLDLRKPHKPAAYAKPWNGTLETIAAIYGANASGKSTMCEGMYTLQHLVLESFRRGISLVPAYALGDEPKDEPTYLTATFVADDGICYSYGVGVQGNRVVEEWAEKYTTPRPTLLFERVGGEFTYGTALTGPKKSVQQVVTDQSLYLSAAAASGLEGLLPLHRWFERGFAYYSANGHRGFFPTVFDALEKDEAARKRVMGLMAEADLGLRDIELKRRPPTSLELQIMRRQAAAQADLGETVAIPEELVEATFLHAGETGPVALDFDVESDGTKAMLAHAFVADQALSTGRTVVFDEIDASLHPLLVAAMLRVFLDPERNPKQAQFLFTTHDVSLLEPTSPGGAAINREQMWVTEKARDGASTLTQVAEYRIKKEDNLRRRYLAGRYGGIPENGEFDTLGSLVGGGV